MSAGGKAHNSYVVGVYLPFGSMGFYDPHGLANIGHGDFVVSVRHAVFEDNEGDALMFEVVGIGISFVVVGQKGISSSRAHDDSSSCIFPFG